jgi:acetylornithine deacetylase/succinyl-diaminopimelate desuccinylase-like protein
MRLAPAIAALSLLVAPAGRAAEPPKAPALALTPERAAALRARIAADLPRIVEQWIAISEIPAPSGEESARGARIEKELRALGLEEVRRDEIGNVFGVLRGRAPGGGKRVVYAAHLDTVAHRTDPVGVGRPDRGRLQGPGIRDDASGLVGLLEAVRALKEAGLTPPDDVWIVATVQEEIGLLGAKKFLDDNAPRIARFIAVDGELGEISYGATGIVWLKVRFLSDGAHTLKSPGLPNPAHALARAITAISSLDAPRTPESRESWVNVSMLSGADVVNAMPADAWFTVDIRSNSPAMLERLVRSVREDSERAARAAGVSVAFEEILRIPGAAPRGSAGSPFVTLVADALLAAGEGPPTLTMRGTADHNRALERGIPGLAIGVTTGAGIHTPRETASIDRLPGGIAALAILMASLPAELPPGATANNGVRPNVTK